MTNDHPDRCPKKQALARGETNVLLGRFLGTAPSKTAVKSAAHCKLATIVEAVALKRGSGDGS